MQVLINATSAGTGGGYSVARELSRHIARCRPTWSVLLGAIAEHPLQREFQAEAMPENCQIAWLQAAAMRRPNRRRVEAAWLRNLRDAGLSATVQLNGMVSPEVKVPALCHYQDPWPFRSEARRSIWDGVLASLKRIAIRRSMRLARHCGWTSQYLRNLICSHSRFFPEGSIFYNGIAECWSTLEDIPPLENRLNEILTVSNVSHYKRQWLVIDALPDVISQTNLKVVYRIVGSCTPEYKAELLARAKKRGVGDCVFVEGRLPESEVIQHAKRASVFSLMSVCESFGIPPIEAMAAGIPVVAADCCALPEVCGDAAVLVPTDDVDALAKSLALLLTDRNLSATYRERGLKRSKNFTWQRTAEKMASELESIASCSR